MTAERLEAEKLRKQRKIWMVIELLGDLTDEERYAIFCMFCTHCGSKTLPCNCMRDE